MWQWEQNQSVSGGDLMSLSRSFAQSGVLNSLGQHAVTHKVTDSAELMCVHSGPSEATRQCLPCV